MWKKLCATSLNLLFFSTCFFSLSAQEPVNAFKVREPVGVGISPSAYLWIAGQSELLVFRNDTLFAQNSLQRFGPLHSVDFSNPLKSLLFYRENGQLVFVDNTVTEVAAAVDLTLQGLEQSTAACISYDNGIWLFISDEMRLLRLDSRLNISSEVPNIHLLLKKPFVYVRQMAERSNVLWINVQEEGLARFDVFGGLISYIPLPGIRHFWLTQNGAMAFDNQNNLWSFNPPTFKPEKMLQCEKCTHALFWHKGKIYDRKPTEIQIFTD